MKAGFSALGGARAQAILLLVLAFLAGTVSGGALERVAIRKQWDRMRPSMARGGGMVPGFFGGRRGTPGSGPGGGPGGAGPGGAGFYEQLGLSDAQRKQIDAIVEKRRARIDSVMKLSGGVMRAAMDSTRSEIDAVLSPGQRAQADSLRAARRNSRGGRGFGGDSARARGAPPGAGSAGD